MFNKHFPLDQSIDQSEVEQTTSDEPCEKIQEKYKFRLFD